MQGFWILWGAVLFRLKEIVKFIENRPSGSETESECQLPSWKKSFKGD